MVKIETLKVNQVIVNDNENYTFFSYNTPIVTKLSTGEVVLHTDWNYSVTTSKYRNMFLGETIKETRAKLPEGTYTLRSAYA